MAKYSFEFKKKIVQEYLAGKEGYKYLAKKYNIGNRGSEQIHRWVESYKKFGDEGLRRSRKKILILLNLNFMW